MAKQYESILKDLKEGNTSPVYCFHGEEPFFADQLTAWMEKNIIDPSHRDFNQMVLYGRDVNYPSLLDMLRQFPMMAEKKLVVVREAQALPRPGLSALESYFKNPSPTTIFVLCLKGKKVDKRTAAVKAIDKAGVLFESKKLYDNEVPKWIAGQIKSQGLNIEPGGAEMMFEFLGGDLSKINNELSKILVNLKGEKTISLATIQDNIGLNRSYNVFEYVKAILQKDEVKVMRMLQYFESKPNSAPGPLVMASLYNSFSRMMIAKEVGTSNRSALAKQLGISPYFVGDYIDGVRKYSSKEMLNAIDLLLEYDMRMKGIGSMSNRPTDLLTELSTKLLRGYPAQIPEVSGV